MSASVWQQRMFCTSAMLSCDRQNAAAIGQLETLQSVRNGQLGRLMLSLISSHMFGEPGASSQRMECEPLNGSV